MKFFADILLLLIAALHLYILVLEMFLWRTPLGRRAFGTTAEFAAATRVLAANQGLYNGFLALGLVWSYWRGDMALQLFFLGCVLAAGGVRRVERQPQNSVGAGAAGRDRDAGGLGGALTRRLAASFRRIFGE